MVVCALIAAAVLVAVGAAKAGANGPTRHPAHSAHAMQHVQPGPAPYRQAKMTLCRARTYVSRHPHQKALLCTSWGYDSPYQKIPSIGFTCKKQAANIGANLVECGGLAGLGAWAGGPEGAAIAFGGCEFSKGMNWWQKKVGSMYRLTPNGRYVRR